MNSLPEIHTIRLHGPWVARVLAVFGDESKVADEDQERRVKVPSDWSDWLGSDFCGRVAYRRNFNRPTGLEPNQSVRLVVEQVDYRGEVFLNDQPLGNLTLGKLSLGESALGQTDSSHLRVEIGHLLELSNVLRVEIEVAADSDRAQRTGQAGGLIGGVRIEIQQ